MRENRLKRLWQEGQPALGGWLTIPSSFSAEVMAHQGFDWLCIDMQHGLIDYECALQMLQAISTTPAVPVVRVPWNEPGIIMKALDAGAYGVIVPMVNSAAEAQAAVSACRYPPQGARSFGPMRAAYYAGSDYVPRANDEVCCIPMVETTAALERLDEIVSTPGIDAVYVGPSDLSMSLGLPPGSDQEAPAFNEALERIVEACRRHRVVPGIAGNAAVAPRRIEQGFLMVEVFQDTRGLARGALQDLRKVRPEGAEGGQGVY
ncbi:MAG: 2,4-dihydroxyhept-2-ene-1,7-dioic acid aldolase [Chloroflexi bacterium]|nr:2,4-dihydroxyhept-2-ene-1,7-dioic acid aldolase [Chloroflexota bacterium]